MLDYNIEFAHIYADEKLGDEQFKSIELLKKVIKKLEKENKTFSISILIDEFHPVVFKLKKNKVIKEFEEKGVKIDFIGYESKLCPIANKLIKELPKSELKLENFNNPQRKVLLLKNHDSKIGIEEEFEFMSRHTCAILSASWSLCRLGNIEIPKNAIERITKKPFEAKKLITILPEKYRIVENKVLDIIKSTKFENSVKDIEYEFFDN